MKINKKLIAPIFTLASLLAIGVGSTFALFTSSSSNSVTVSAGKVDVKLAVESINLFSASTTDTDATNTVLEGSDQLGDHSTNYYLVKQNGKFFNGGDATYQDSSFTVNKMTPGDKVTFDLKINNLSNVKTKYQISIVSDNSELSKELEVKIGDEEFKNGKYYTNWTSLDKLVSPDEAINCSIYMPLTTDNEYQEASATYVIKIQAVQANAKTIDPNFKLNWVNNTVGSKSLYQVAESSKNVYIGKTSDYATQIASISEENIYNVDESNIGNVQAYIDGDNLYVLSNEEIVLTDELTEQTVEFDEEETNIGMFCECGNIESLEIENVDSSSLTSMKYMFFGLSKVTELDLTALDTNNVTDFSYAISECYELETVDISTFDYSSAKTYQGMFREDTKLETIYSPDFNLDDLDEDGTKDTFENCNELTGQKGTTNTNSDASNGSIDGGESDKGYFSDKNYVPTVSYQLDWNTEKYEDNSKSLHDIASTKQEIYFGTTEAYASAIENLTKISAGETESDLIYAYYDDTKLYVLSDGKIALDDDDTLISDHTMQLGVLGYISTGMFSNFANATKILLNNIDTSNVTRMDSMFFSCTSITQIDVSEFNTSKVTDMSGMFGFMNCGLSESMTLNLSHFDTSNVTNMAVMFAMTNASSINVSSFDVSKVTSLNGMFAQSTHLTKLDLRNFVTSSMEYCVNFLMMSDLLTVLDISNFDFSHLDSEGLGFSGFVDSCDALTTIYSQDMCDYALNTFKGEPFYEDCYNLTGGNGSKSPTISLSNINYCVIDKAGRPGFFTDPDARPEGNL